MSNSGRSNTREKDRGPHAYQVHSVQEWRQPQPRRRRHPGGECRVVCGPALPQERHARILRREGIPICGHESVVNGENLSPRLSCRPQPFFPHSHQPQSSLGGRSAHLQHLPEAGLDSGIHGRGTEGPYNRPEKGETGKSEPYRSISPPRLTFIFERIRDPPHPASAHLPARQ